MLPRARTRGAVVLVSWLALATVSWGAAPVPSWTLSPAPVTTGSMAPRLATDGRDLLLSWVSEGGETEEVEVRFARLDESGWRTPVTIEAGSEIIANWADTPRLFAGDGARLIASWPSRINSPASYGVRLSRSTDGGATWSEPEWLHDDLGAGEHSFAAFLSGRAVWLDGRAMPDGGAMRLMARGVSPKLGVRERVLDDRVCECCSVDTAFAHRGPVLVYRDRSPEEVRDIAIVRQTSEGWHDPARVWSDGWRIHGCPVQGPAVAALADREAFRSSDVLLVAWFTAAADRPQVKVAFSTDGGASFAEPLVVDDTQPEGRVDAELLDEMHGWVAWLDREPRAGALKLAAVDRRGEVEPPEIVAGVAPVRASGFPSLQLWSERLYVAWTDVDAAGRRMVQVAWRPASLSGRSGSR